MKRILAILLAGVLAAGCMGCGQKMQAELKEIKGTAPVNEADTIPDICNSPDGAYEIAVCTGTGSLKDRGFNEHCLNGVKLYATHNGKTYKYYSPPKNATDDDLYGLMAAAVNNKAKIIVAVGFNYGVPLKRAAVDFPDVNFIFVDGWDMGFDNVASAAFREHEGGYLAGYSAVKDGNTKLGFIGGGGGTNGACNRYGRGFVCGAEDAAKELGVKVEVNYSYQYANNFSSSPELQAMTNAWYTNGTQVIFSAAGGAQDSVAASAAANDAWVIACDADASGRSASVLTTSVKRTDVATMTLLDIFYTGKWSEIGGRTLSMGVAEGAVALPTDNWRFQKFTKEEYEKLYDGIASGKIKIDSDSANNKSTDNLTFKPM